MKVIMHEVDIYFSLFYILKFSENCFYVQCVCSCVCLVFPVILCEYGKRFVGGGLSFFSEGMEGNENVIDVCVAFGFSCEFVLGLGPC